MRAVGTLLSAAIQHVQLTSWSRLTEVELMGAPSVSTIKALFAVSGNACAFPGCNQPIVDQSNRVIIGEVSHIMAASPGGPRYDPEQPEEKRHAFDNLILLCAPHHKIIDEQVDQFPIRRLVEIKKEHEARHSHAASALDDVSAQNLISNSTILGSAIQTVHQTGGQAAHVIVNPPWQNKEPALVPLIHAIKPQPGQAYAFCIHIENQGDGTADQVEIRVEHNEVGLPRFSPGFWEMGPSHAPYTFTSLGSIHPRRNERVFQVGFQQDPERFVFKVRIWARNYVPSCHEVSFSRDESQQRRWKAGPKT